MDGDRWVRLDPARAGCAGSQAGPDGRWRLCRTAPVATVTHDVGGSRRRVVRAFVCEAHAVGHPDPRPLTAADRAELRRRRQRATGAGPGLRRSGRGSPPAPG